MASQSAHFNLTKPASTDNYGISVFNDNADIIDAQMYNNQQSAAKEMEKFANGKNFDMPLLGSGSKG